MPSPGRTAILKAFGIYYQSSKASQEPKNLTPPSRGALTFDRYETFYVVRNVSSTSLRAMKVALGRFLILFFALNHKFVGAHETHGGFFHRQQTS
jgi:hypothetical protein